MSHWDVVLPLAALLAGMGTTALAMRGRAVRAGSVRARAKILFPFVGAELSDRALQAALRLAGAEGAVLVPGYLTTVPLQLGLEVPLGRSCDEAFSVFEAIEQRAAGVGVPVDGRIARGRNVRHALRGLIEDEPSATRIVVAAAAEGRHDGFGVEDIAWLLRTARGEVIVLRPGPDGAGPGRAGSRATGGPGCALPR